MKLIHYEKCPPQHAIYGPSAPIAPKLTPENWQEVAILRAKQYVYIARGYWSGGEVEDWRYFVDVSANHDLKADFEELEDAIEYANRLAADSILALRGWHNHSETDIWPLNQLLFVYQQAVQASLAHGGGNGCRGTFVLESQLPGRLELFCQSVQRHTMPVLVFGLQLRYLGRDPRPVQHVMRCPSRCRIRAVMIVSLTVGLGGIA